MFEDNKKKQEDEMNKTKIVSKKKNEIYFFSSSRHIHVVRRIFVFDRIEERDSGGVEHFALRASSASGASRR